jgi:hypothetical protein
MVCRDGSLRPQLQLSSINAGEEVKRCLPKVVNSLRKLMVRVEDLVSVIL